MTDTDTKSRYAGFCRAADAIALALLLNTALAQISPRVRQGVSNILADVGLQNGSNAYSYITSIVSIILYCIVFFLPALFIFKYAPTDIKRINTSPVIPKKFPLTVIAVLGSIALSGRITVLITELLQKAGIGFISYGHEVSRDPLSIILLFISSAAVPAVTEELLFRKAVLERLAPYGNGFAVTVTAAAFALMHTNPSQLLFTFTAGLLLGYITVNTGSVVPAVIIHFANNALSIIYLVLREFTSDSFSSRTELAVDTLLMTAAVVILCFYAGMLYKKSRCPRRNPIVLDFSPSKKLFRVFTVGYIAYTLFLMTRWIYII